MKKLVLKFLFVVASIQYPRIRKDYRYFIRDNYYARLRQIRFFFKDYISKSPYKEIEFQGEFDQELRYVIPFAYWHYKNGTLKKTISSKNTKPFYFFSDNHEERHTKRIWELGYTNFEIPNMTHSANFSYTKWTRVPFKSHYANSRFKFDKPTLIIANKYNVEWDQAPINFFSLKTIEWIVQNYSAKYQIVYNRPLSTQIVSDNSDTLDLKEHSWLRLNYPEVILMNDLFDTYKDEVENFNHLQLLVYANCDHFISAHGGTAAFASYFGGKNIILSKRGIEHELREFETILPALSGCKIYHAKSEEEVILLLSDHF
ncbi:hypothetical protein [Pedobacter faecalis]|uniref:hypothetical protein n=1 Tax=Pedobacter faecalis TaxID=3041495 RepID=UPI00254F082F|nr:hypothetical protein [Pedobacter sp. ELA7]